MRCARRSLGARRRRRHARRRLRLHGQRSAGRKLQRARAVAGGAQRGERGDGEASTRSRPSSPQKRDELKALSARDQGGREGRSPRSRREIAAAPRGRPQRARPERARRHGRGGQPVVRTWGEKPTLRVHAEGRTGTSARRSASSTSSARAKSRARASPCCFGAAARLERALISLHARPAHARARLHRGAAAVPREGLGAARHRAAAQVRGGPVQDRRRATRSAPTTSTSSRRPRSRSRTSTPTRSSRRGSCRSPTPRTRRASAARPGSHGKDVRGLIRQHQFDKVELVRFVDAGGPAAPARAAHQRTPRRCCSASACTTAWSRSAPATWASASQKTYDLEVWLPGPGRVPRDLRAARTSATSRRAAPRSATGPSRRRSRAWSTRSTARRSRSAARSSRSSSSTSRPTAAWSCPRRSGRSWAARSSAAGSSDGSGRGGQA